MALTGGPKPVVPPQFSNFAKNGGWSVLGNPANNYAAARGFQTALMNTAQHPHGTAPAQHPAAAPHPGSSPATGQSTAPTSGGRPPATPPPLPSPFDATYYANINANQFKANNDINNLNLQGAQNDTALAQALAQLNYQQPRDSLKAEQSFNNRGGLYSSVENQALGDLTHSYAQKQTEAQTSHDNTSSKLAAQIAAINAGIPIYNSQQEAASASRLAAAAAKDPTLGEGTGGLDTQPGRVTGGIQQGINNAAAKNAALPPAKVPNTTPPQTKAFVNNGGWSVLGNPANNYANARGYQGALMNTAKNPHGVLATAIGKKKGKK